MTSFPINRKAVDKTNERKVNVLAIDDNPANLIALHAVLAREFNLLEAGSAREGLEILRSNSSVDVILLDIQMPDIDGFEAAALIKKIPGCENIPLIFITAVYKEDPFIKQGYDVGGIDYFSKPFDPEILRRKVAIYGSFRQRADLLAAREKQVRETEVLLETGRKLSTTLESLPIGVLVVDGDGQIRQANAAAARIWVEIDSKSRGANLSTEPLTVQAQAGFRSLLGWWDESGQMRSSQMGSNQIRSNQANSGQANLSETTPLEMALYRDLSTHGFEISQNHVRLSFSVSPLHSSMNGHEGRVVGAVIVVHNRTESRRVEEELEEKISRFLSLDVFEQELTENLNG